MNQPSSVHGAASAWMLLLSISQRHTMLARPFAHLKRALLNSTKALYGLARSLTGIFQTRQLKSELSLALPMLLFGRSRAQLERTICGGPDEQHCLSGEPDKFNLVLKVLWSGPIWPSLPLWFTWGLSSNMPYIPAATSMMKFLILLPSSAPLSTLHSSSCFKIWLSSSCSAEPLASPVLNYPWYVITYFIILPFCPWSE